MRPITPEEAKINFQESLPDFVIGAVNACILKECFGKESFTIKQETIVNEILKLAPEGTSRSSVFDNHWLDFEELFSKFGWDVKYERPGWDETFDENFKFKTKKR